MLPQAQRERLSPSCAGASLAPATAIRCWSPLAEREHRVVCMMSQIGGVVPPHMHARHHLGVVEQGTAIVRSEGRRWKVGAGDVIWHVPRQMHDISSESCRCRWVAIDEKVVDQIMVAFGTRTPEETRVFTDGALAAGFLALHRGLERGAITRSAAETLAAILAALAGAPANSAVVSPLLCAPVERCRMAIRNGYAESLRLIDLARIAGMSLFHLARTFAAALSVPPHAYLLHLRVAWAQSLLRRGLAGSRVAYEVGFADQSHCIRVHRRLLGLSPFAVLSLEGELPVRADDFGQLSDSARRAVASIWQS